MTAANSADQPQDDLVPAQEKLEWVTPKISLMGSGDTDGNKIPFGAEIGTFPTTAEGS
jgi:hypothetical protein